MGVLWAAPQYAGSAIDPASVDADPIAQFRAWMADALAANIHNANAMTLATVDERGRPVARVVLLKDVVDGAFVFFTNYASRKGRELEANGFAALCLYWDPLYRQVRVEGAVSRVDPADSDAYFASRPRGSQIGAIASPQSQVIATRAELEAKVAAVEAEVGEGVPARPAHWGGYRVVPDLVELWQGQPSRLHDRVRYTRAAQGWTRERLAP